ncbi:hypothetical protein ACQP2Y_21785 [Actinoplanes sp. CA-051413]|uniref:hypothetical protein n=1 Tax=Actinoplanes sp. CA-051413 TaxID=3239899 RepID=UPI003D991C61
MNDYLTGPWTAFLSEPDGYVIDSLADAESGEVEISIRRGTALPDDEGHLPGSYRGDDLIEIFEDYIEEGAVARWAQAQAMASGLNAAAEVATR